MGSERAVRAEGEKGRNSVETRVRERGHMDVGMGTGKGNYNAALAE